ncbi:MAG: tautomerase family protein [Pseudorhodoplanes sp.]|nr:tautomerase family protein [Pseudorhodoplanes sp.]
MPMITVQYAAPNAPAGLPDVVGKAANWLSSEFLGKDPSITAVTVEELDPAKWLIGNKSLRDHGLAAFWLDIRVVDGTNTREQKAAFIAAAFAKMSELLGPLHSESYVYVNEVRGDAYGYGGMTQNERYIAGKLRGAVKTAA